LNSPAKAKGAKKEFTDEIDRMFETTDSPSRDDRLHWSGSLDTRSRYTGNRSDYPEQSAYAVSKGLSSTVIGKSDWNVETMALVSVAVVSDSVLGISELAISDGSSSLRLHRCFGSP